MSGRRSKYLLATSAALAALALGGCGDSHTRVSTGTYAGESGASAPYLNVGPLIYQVQISRELNPYNTADAPYLEGLSPAQRTLGPGQEWFGVFIQVYNNTSQAHLAATNITIADTQNNVYFPVVPDLSNQFAYRAGLVPGASRVPALDSVAANGASQGALILFKIGIVSLDNRPIRLTIVDPTNAAESASATLDV